MTALEVRFLGIRKQDFHHGFHEFFDIRSRTPKIHHLIKNIRLHCELVDTLFVENFHTKLRSLFVVQKNQPFLMNLKNNRHAVRLQFFSRNSKKNSEICPSQKLPFSCARHMRTRKTIWPTSKGSRARSRRLQGYISRLWRQDFSNSHFLEEMILKKDKFNSSFDFFLIF